MSWLGLRHKGTEPLYSREWNTVVDALDILYGYVSGLDARLDALEDSVEQYYLETKRELGVIEQKIDNYYGYLSDGISKLGDKVDQYYLETKSELETLDQKIDRYYGSLVEITRQPEAIDTFTILVGATPIPLTEVDMVVRRIHLKVPSWAFYLVYVGDSTKQDFILEKGDILGLEVKNPKNVYVRSLGDVTIYVSLEK